MKLICLTHAGGSASFYGPLKEKLSPNIEVVALEYAGHGARRGEVCCTSVEEMVADLYKQLGTRLEPSEQYAVMGYSMGAIVAADLVMRICESDEFARPVHLFLAAHEPDHKRELIDFSKEEADEVVMERTIRFGGVPDSIRDNKVFWRLYLPVYKADYSLLQEYRFDRLYFGRRIPATVFYSETDTSEAAIRKWSEHFETECEYIRYSGNHFFIMDHVGEMADVIANRIG